MGTLDVNQAIRSPSSEGDSGSDDEESSMSQRTRGRSSHFPAIAHSHWFPRPIAFRGFSARVIGQKEQTAQNGGGRLHIQVSRPLVAKLTKDIVDTYQICNPSFDYSETLNPKRYLTVPSTGTSNNGLDNVNHDLILYFNGVLVNKDATRRYVVKDIVGHGTFGQVAKCLVTETNDVVAVKVIKNQPAYYTQAKVEIGILHMLNNNYDPVDKHHIVRSFDHFSFQGHLCLVFELLTVNLFELLKTNNLKGISLNLVRLFSKQLIEALTLLRDASVIHCDLKPENILLTRSVQTAQIKLIDFGSACMEDQTVYSYIQSRYYRSPEVLLGHPYTIAIDMWSLGCVAAELFLGLPLFPGTCEYDLLLFINEKLGTQPPDHILQNAKYTSKFFKLTSAAPRSDQSRTGGQPSAYQFLSAEEHEAREGKRPVIGKRFIPGTLEEMIMDRYFLRITPEEDKQRELEARKVFIDFLRGLVECDPKKRWTPRQAAQHPFLTEEPFTGSFRPRTETPRTPVCQGLIEHKAGSGHWSGAGLSPQVGNLSLNARHNGSPHYPAVPYSLASSHGSVGSYGSYGDGVPLGSSVGSYGDAAGQCMSYPAGMNVQTTMLGGSPDTGWWRLPGASIPGVGHTQLGMSPSGVGGWPLSLGASPSCSSGTHFQPSPDSQYPSPGSRYLPSPASAFHSSPGGSSFHPSPGSPSLGSPNRYGPTSPARGVGVPCGLREAAFGQLNKRRMWPGVPAPPSGVGPSSHESMNVHLARIQQNNASGNIDTVSSTYVQAQGVNRMAPPPQWRPARNGGTSGMLHHPTYAPGSLGSLLATPDHLTEGGEEEGASDPADSDFNDSGEFLFQEDLQDAGYGNVPGPNMMGSSGAQSGPGPGPFSGPGPGFPGGMSIGHTYAHLQGGLPNGQNMPRMEQGQAGPPINMDASPPSQQNLQQGLQGAYARNMGPKAGPYSPNHHSSPSRLGPSVQWQQQLHQHPHLHQHQPYCSSPQQSPDIQMVPNLGPNSGPGGWRQLSGEASGSSPSGMLPFQQRQQRQQQQYLSPHQSPDLQTSPNVGHPKSRIIGEAGSSSPDRLFPPPQRENRRPYPGPSYVANGHGAGMANGGYGMDGNPSAGRGFPMATGTHFAVPNAYHNVADGSSHWPAAPSNFMPNGQLFATDLLSGRRHGQYLGGGFVRPPVPTVPARREYQ